MDDKEIINSSLCDFISREELTVKVEIYRDQDSGWILEVVDEHGNSTVWDDVFDTDQRALDEALRTIDQEGIAALIGAPSIRNAGAMSRAGISQADLILLEDFLDSPACGPASMDIAALDGFLTAVVIGPRLIMPFEWMRWIWDSDEGEALPEFDNGEQASRIMSIVMHHHHSIAQAFASDPESFEPMFWRDVGHGAEQWCTGFMIGYDLDSTSWTLLAAMQPSWFTPFLRLGTEVGFAMTEKIKDAKQCREKIIPSLLKIFGYWTQSQASELLAQNESAMNLPRTNGVGTFVHTEPKIGRNEPCFCGSGKKFKKCCSAT